MPNASPHVARMARKRKRKPGDLKAVAVTVWEALEVARELLGHEEATLRLKAVHAVGQVAGAYARVYEVGELEARLAALEALDRTA